MIYIISTKISPHTNSGEPKTHSRIIQIIVLLLTPNAQQSKILFNVPMLPMGGWPNDISPMPILPHAIKDYDLYGWLRSIGKCLRKNPLKRSVSV